MITVKFSRQLQKFTNGVPSVTINAVMPNLVYEELTNKYPELGKNLFINKKVSQFVCVLLNNELVDTNDSAVQFKHGDNLEFMIGIAGG